MRFILLCVLWGCSSSRICNIKDFGAVGDGKHNDTDAVYKAINSCGGTPGSTLYIPKGDFVTWPIIIGSSWNHGTVQLDGQILSPDEPSEWPSEHIGQYVTIDNVKNFTVKGTGTVNGRGMKWWKIRHVKPFTFAPNIFGLYNSDTVTITGITLLNAAEHNLIISNDRNVNVEGLTVLAPESSPNTDAFDIGHSTNVRIAHNKVSNGDDCVAVSDQCKDILVEYNHCNYSHGISIGSLGARNSGAAVESITFRHNFLQNSENGARIKTWQGGHGYARNITFENTTVVGVNNPIRITQYYCPHSQHPKPCKNQTSAVKISDIHINGLTGTHHGKYAAYLACSDSIPCENIIIENVDLKAVSGESQNEFFCWEVYGTSKNVYPKSCVKTHKK